MWAWAAIELMAAGVTVRAAYAQPHRPARRRRRATGATSPTRPSSGTPLDRSAGSKDPRPPGTAQPSRRLGVRFERRMGDRPRPSASAGSAPPCRGHRWCREPEGDRLWRSKRTVSTLVAAIPDPTGIRCAERTMAVPRSSSTPMAAGSQVSRCSAGGPTDAAVTDFGPIGSVFIRDPDGLEGEMRVHPPGSDSGDGSGQTIVSRSALFTSIRRTVHST
jgi:hypothetical protein